MADQPPPANWQDDGDHLPGALGGDGDQTRGNTRGSDLGTRGSDWQQADFDSAAEAYARSGLFDLGPLANDDLRTTYPPVEGLSNVRGAPKFSFGNRLKVLQGEKTNIDVPGPGSYYECHTDHLAKYKRSPQCSFGSATRQDSRRARVPGPGAYMQKPTIGTGGSAQYSCTPRRPDPTGRGKVPPGPGAHDLPVYVGHVGPRHTMTPRRKEGPDMCGPGPGDYASGAARFNADTLVASKVPQFSFGSSAQRPKDLAERTEATPGPGAYRQEGPKGGPRFSMRARTAGPKERLAKF